MPGSYIYPLFSTHLCTELILLNPRIIIYNLSFVGGKELFAPEGHDYTSALQDRKLKLREEQYIAEAMPCGMQYPTAG
jgi:hypothetical protein